jgi:hypothetical protein
MHSLDQLRGVSTFLTAVLMLVTVTTVAQADGDPAPEHRKLQDRPIQLGTSGGNINDRSRFSCTSGTLGALVEAGGTQYILSNNHVLARENAGQTGDLIIQPGLIDQQPVCSQDQNDGVATLSRFQALLFGRGQRNTVDAAIAQVRPNAVRSDGAILDIGMISSSATDATVGMRVQKSGRTTGLTKGDVTATDGTFSIRYGNRLAYFYNQIVISPGTFSAGGDSGSLIVEDVPSAPRAVGLLFAGSSSSTIANPICAVLSALSVSMVGVADSRPACSTAATGGATPQQATAQAAKRRHEDALLQIPSIVGAAVGRDGAIEVYLANENAEARRQIPPQLENVPVRVTVTGEFVAR